MDRDLVAYTAALAVAMPPLVAFVVQSHWRKRTKRLIAFLACLSSGVGVVLTSDVSLHDALAVAPTLLVATQVVYHVFWKSTRLLPWLEQTTDVATLRRRLETALSSDDEDRPRRSRRHTGPAAS